MKYTFVPLLLLVVTLFLSCDRNNNFIPQEPTIVDLPYTFEDGFEAENLDNLFPEDGSRWTNIQEQDPLNGENTINLSSEQFTEGEQA